MWNLASRHNIFLPTKNWVEFEYPFGEPRSDTARAIA
jgi:hypothetical protein